jgi:hypothetical protein
MNRSLTQRLCAMGISCLALLSALSLATTANAKLTGAIFTTDSTCTGVNKNIYETKKDVFLNGGPQNNNLAAAGLTDGFYYVKITSPSGDLLGTSIGTGINIGGLDDQVLQVVNGSFVTCQRLWDILIKNSDGSTGYDNTPNPGGEYKVWVSTVPTFDNDDTKTDNFKIKINCDSGGNDCGGGPPQSAISGVKFLDKDASGTQDPGELGLENWVIQITVTLPTGTFSVPDCDGNLHTGGETFTDCATTDAFGNWSKLYPQGTQFKACEVQQTGYHQTSPLDGANVSCTDATGTGGATASKGCWSGTLGINDECNLNFGNVQFQALTITKTATPSFTRTFGWSITKDVDKPLVEQIGGTATFNYTVKVTKDAGTDSAWGVNGTISISNPNAFPISVSSITDSIQSENNANCTPESTSGTVPGNDKLEIKYSCSYSKAPATGTEANSASASYDDGDGNTGTITTDPAVSFTFDTPTTVVDDCVTVKDTFNGTTSTLGSPCATTTYTYSHTVNVPASNCVTYTNAACFKTIDTQTTGSALKSVEVCGPAKTGALTIGFWQNKNGQGIITGGSSTLGVCNSGAWLRNYAPFQDLSATAKCSDVATYVYNIIKAANASGAAMNAMLKAQMLATALDVYFSDPALGGNKIGAPGPIGAVSIDLTKICKMIDGSGGSGTCGGSYEDASSAFGGAKKLSVLQLLNYAATQSNAGGSTWYGQVKATQGLAKDTFDAINNGVAFSP